ncbi:hypothetical protein [Haloarcula sp. JP-L23]|uniref:hypothetical protein n=1 Tax=Haloarcula sp. JP-L23 TaxID=2716717 RepID=UPI00140F26C5|nr:hypothetical protein G9465_16245 [Haloarcula sp. JP-L23]
MRRPALHVALAACLVLAGCSVLGDDPVREQAAVDRLDAARERAETIESYRYDLAVTVSTTASAREIDGSGVGKVNVTTRRTATNLTVDGATSQTYVDNRTALVECRGGGGVPSGFWGKEEFPAERNWTETTPLGRQLALLSSGDLYHNGTETVDGRETVHLSGSPSKEALDAYRDGAGNRPLFGSPNIDSVTVDLWLDATTNRPVRSEVQVVVSGDGETATATLTTRFRDYGERVRVTIPAEARDDAFGGGCPG